MYIKINDIMTKFVECSKHYEYMRYSSLEKIIKNSIDKNRDNTARSNQIIENSIKSHNRQWKNDKEANKKMRTLKNWLKNELDNHNQIDLVSIRITYS